MEWIRHFQLFLFDFDGLLVNTEHLHFQAYVNMLNKRGYSLDLSFAQFCELAHLHAGALREAIYAKFPDLDPDWDSLYAQKTQICLELIASGKVELMPGVHKLLCALLDANIRSAVVTNSTLNQVQIIRAQIPILQTIANWVTREDYEKPKPNPDAYLRAIQLYGKKGDKIVGFEDSLKGFQALLQTPALAVLICSKLDFDHFSVRFSQPFEVQSAATSCNGVIPPIVGTSPPIAPQNLAKIISKNGQSRAKRHPLLEMALESGKGLHFESFEQIPDTQIGWPLCVE
jgi:HAD superfamily hydrolase (TIGR01509 family)